MKVALRYSLVLACAYLVFLVATVPAAQVYYWLHSKGGLPAEFYQVSGTVWSGMAAPVVIAGTVIDSLEWSFRPLSLLRGRVEYDLEASHGRGRLDATAGRTLNGALYARETRLTMPVNDMVMLAGEPDMGLTGMLNAEVKHILFNENRIARIDGRAEVTDAGIGPPLNIALGGFTMNFESDDEAVRGVLTDAEGPLQTSGVLVLQPDGTYRFTAELTARESANSEVLQALHTIGRPDRTGKVSLTHQGRIPLDRVWPQALD